MSIRPTVVFYIITACVALSGALVASAQYSEPSVPPVLMITASPASVSANTGTTIYWDVDNASSCFAWGGDAGWAAKGGSVDYLTGSYSYATGPLVSDTTFYLRCNNPSGGTGNRSVTVTVSAPLPSGNISASPNPCAIPGYNDSNPVRDQNPYYSPNTCATRITWTSNMPSAAVFVSGCGQGTNALFAQAQNGSVVAPWIDVTGCTFDLRVANDPFSALIAQLPSAPNTSDDHRAHALKTDCTWVGPTLQGAASSPSNLPFGPGVGSPIGRNITVPDITNVYFRWTSQTTSSCQMNWDGTSFIGFTSGNQWQGSFTSACNDPVWCSPPPPGRFVRSVTCWDVDASHASQAVCTIQAQPPAPPPPPTVSMWVTQPWVPYGGITKYAWTSSGADYCDFYINGTWVGNGPPNGVNQWWPINNPGGWDDAVYGTKTYTINCRNNPTNNLWAASSATVRVVPNYSACVSVTGVPASIPAGGSFSAIVTMQNLGSNPWTTDGTPHRLGAWNPQDNMIWGTNRVALPSEPVLPGATVGFTVNAIAPSTPGTYAFDWRMVEDFVEWFGPVCGSAVPVTVTPPPLVVSSCSASPSSVTTLQPVTWTANGVSGGTGVYTYSWSGTAPLNVQTTNPAMVSYIVPGVKTGAVTVTSGTQTVGPIDCAGSVTVNPPSYLVSTAVLGGSGSFTPPSATVVQGGNTSFTVTASPGYKISGIVMSNGNAVGGGASCAGSTTCTYTVTNVVGNTTVNATFVVADPTVSVLVSPSSVTWPGTFRVTMSSTNATSCVYSRTSSYGGDWANVPTAGVPTLNSPTGYDSGIISYGVGNATWTFTCQNAIGVTASASASVTVSPAPLTVASCSATPGAVIVGEPVTWTANGVSGGTGSYTYLWSGSAPLGGLTNPIVVSYPTPGSKTGSVTVISGAQTVGPIACARPVIVSLPNPVISVVPSIQLGFGNVGIGASKTLTFQVSNTGDTGSLLSGAVTISGTDAARFLCISNCVYANLSVGAPAWTVTMRYSPTTVGNNTANADFTGGGGKTVPMLGTGSIDIICLSCGPSGDLDFGKVAIGRSKDLILSIVNNGTTNYGLDVISFSSATPFTCVSGCNLNLSPGVTNNINIRFRPTLVQGYSETAFPSTYPSVKFTLHGEGVLGTIRFNDL